MNRERCEKQIHQKLKEIVEIYHKYNPDGNYLTLAYIRDDKSTALFFSNEFYKEGRDETIPLDFFHSVREGEMYETDRKA